jgi:hypothetical protein
VFQGLVHCRAFCQLNIYGSCSNEHNSEDGVWKKMEVPKFSYETVCYIFEFVLRCHRDRPAFVVLRQRTVESL